MADAMIIQALRETTQALKDIVNAADNNEPYSMEELEEVFSPIIDQGEEAIEVIDYNAGFNTWKRSHC